MKKLVFILLFVSFFRWSPAQTVGLVLSGGGAKGLYHVGIIKALEENGIPIDYISGASMGAIVGGMYAAGYSPDEMIEFFVTDSVREWLAGRIPDEYRYYFRRFEPTPEMIAININPDPSSKQAVQLPTNIISPYRIDLAFMNMITPASVAADDDFDKLMVPFRCVAADVYNKKTVVLDEGSLAFAIRASMTLPLAFTPLKKDSILLYDGGVYNNFPWQPLDSAFHPDIYIGGICASNYDNPGQDDIINQVSVMITGMTDYSLPDSSDIIIRRRFKDVSTLDYGSAAYIMVRGYEDAMAQMPDMLRKIPRRVTPAEVDAKRKAFKSRIKPLVFEQVLIEGLNPNQTDYVMRQLGITRDQIVDAEYFQRKYMRILATGVFKADFPEVTFNAETGYYRLKINMSTRPSMKISLGGNLSSTSLNQLYIGAQHRTVGRSASTYRIDGYLGTFYNSVRLGGRHDIYTQFPFYIDYTYGYETRNPDTYNSAAYYKNHAWRYKKHNNNYISSSIAVPVLDNAAFRGYLSGGIRNDEYFHTYHTAEDKPDKSRLTYATLGVEMQNHTLDYPLYPQSGVDQVLAIQYNSGIEKYTPGTTALPGIEAFGGINRNWFAVYFKREQYVAANRWFTFGYLVEASYSNIGHMANSLMTAIMSPSFAPTPTSSTLFMPEYTSSAYAGAGVIPVFRFIGNTFYAKTYFMSFMPREIVYQDGKWLSGNIWKRIRDEVEYIFGGSLVYQTRIGPASLTVEKYTTGPANWHVTLNFGYTLFRKRPY